MTFKFMRPALAIALALTLGACGGKAGFTIGGTVSGLQYKGLVLNTNGMDLSLPPGPITPVGATPYSATFAFPNQISYGELYEVTVKTQPEHQTCLVGPYSDSTGKVHGGAKDSAGRLAVIDVGVLCSVNSYAVGGTITGLTSDGLVLTNGSVGGTTGAASTATSFTLPPVPYGTTYGVSVLTQPAKENCTVTQNGTGVMGDAAVTNIVVSCSPKPAA